MAADRRRDWPGVAARRVPRERVDLTPQTPADDSCWIVILDANDPTKKVQEFVVLGQNNSAVPSGLDTNMSDPANLFVVVTQHLSTLHVPQVISTTIS